MDLYVYNLDEYSSDTRQENKYTPIWPFRLAVAGSSDSEKTTMLINLLIENAKAKEDGTRYILCDEIVLIAQRFYAIPIAIRENVNYISLHGGHDSLSNTKRIIKQYTNKSDSLAPIIDELTLSREFIIFDLRRPKTDPLSIRVQWDTSLRTIMESSNNDSKMITCSSKIDLRSSKNNSRMITDSSKFNLRSSKNDSRMITDSSKINLRSSKNDSRTILESSKNDLSRFTSYGQKAIAEAKKNNLLEEFAQNFPSPKERKLYLKQDALSKAKNSDIWAKYVFREVYGINDRTLGNEYKKFLFQVKNVYITKDNFPVSVSLLIDIKNF
ncbi:hypothetical protein RclHR1_37030001 [Rhizophagus clarus]|uniref:Uncharacterized protein n=1 Tax=Rhizophagus clarus TaxID=94130 RepID=A0A2Z6RDG8_9GLOM|nr:hypothetical protein RclHR1_37030001 [Rhizophagus clarus]